MWHLPGAVGGRLSRFFIHSRVVYATVNKKMPGFCSKAHRFNISLTHTKQNKTNHLGLTGKVQTHIVWVLVHVP